MSKSQSFIDDVAVIVSELDSKGLTPVMIGGMALVVLGSRRVTKDFDFMISLEARDADELFSIMYAHGMALVSKLNDKGDVIATIGNQKVAQARLQIDEPASAYFYNGKTGLRIDILFDFPIPVSELLKKAHKKKIKSHVFTIASKEDLIKLKKIAKKNRSQASDIQDLEFLKKCEQNE